MKNSSFAKFGIGFIASTFLISFQLLAMNEGVSRENAKDLRYNILKIKLELNGTQKDSLNDFQKFKAESEAKIKAQEKNIDELRAKIVKETQKDKIKVEKKLAEIERENGDLKKNWLNIKKKEKNN